MSVVRELRLQLRDVPLLYVADQAHVPYGSRDLEEVRGFAHAITRFLLGQGARLIVTACNTASAAALHDLRREWPDVPFVGMEPAIKPAAEDTASGVVGVLATPATFQGKLYASLMSRFAEGVLVLQDTCPGLVAEIEAGHLEEPQTEAILRRAVEPMLVKGADEIVLGCTHYPFVGPLLERIVGKGVRIIDPAPAVARQAARLWKGLPILNKAEETNDLFLTSGDPDVFVKQLISLLGKGLKAGSRVGGISWKASGLQLPGSERGLEIEPRTIRYLA